MFTNNYIEYQKALLTNGTRWVKLRGGDDVTISGQYSANGGLAGWMKTVRPSYESPASAGATSYDRTYAGLYFGTGTTPPTKGDYTIESRASANLSVSAGSLMSYKDDDGNYVYYVDYAITNTGTDTTQISEICLFIPMTSSSSSTSYYCVLAERTVLDEPIVIEGGKAKVVTYKITFNPN
jgi:hypothetical protein